MFEIIRTYQDGSKRPVLKNLSEEAADKYMAKAVITGTGAKGTFVDSKVAQV